MRGGEREEEAQTSNKQKHGGWITFPFIICSFACLTLATEGWVANLIVYFIKEYNISSINATLIFNILNGCLCFFPVLGAVLADSFFGSFFVIAISTFISLLGMISLTLTATIHSLRPQSCDHNSTSITCSSSSPSKLQYTILYLSIILASLGAGGSRFTTSTLGANQYDTIKDQNIFFDWFFFTLYAGFFIGSTAIVYVQDNVSWGLGYGICLASNVISAVVFLLGNRFYRLDKPRGSPFTALARVLVATARKGLAWAPSTTTGNDNSRCYYYSEDHYLGKLPVDGMLKKNFRCLNEAALITPGDVHLDGTIAKPWRLCKVEEVEDFKTLLKFFPLLSSSVFLSIPIIIQRSLIVLQILTMDRHIGPNFEMPVGSFYVIIFMSTAISLIIIDRFLYLFCKKLIKRTPRPLERVGIGHIFNILSMAVSALVESKRLKIAHHLQDPVKTIVSMSSFWLFPQLVLVGSGEAFHFPGQVGLYYQEFPTSLRSTATAMMSLVVAIASYLSTGLIDLFHKVTKWLPDDINHGRLDNVYWMMTIIGVVNFGYYLVCAKFYKYQNVENDVNNDSLSKD